MVDNVARLMIETREKYELTQEELAELLGVARSTVARIEKGKQSAGAYIVSQMCAVFGLDANEMMGIPKAE